MKRSPSRRTVLGGLIAAPFVPKGAFARPLDKIAETGVLRVATYEDFRPFCFRQDGKYTGIDVSLAQALADHLKMKLDLIVRMAGEDVGADLRANIWRGPLFGGGVADVMLHVPAEKMFTRNLEHVMVANPYYRHSLALMVDGRTEHTPGYDMVNEVPVAVETKSLGDTFLLSRFREGALKNLKHFVRLEEAVAAFRKGEVAAVVGPRAMMEGMTFPKPEGVRLYTPSLGAPFQRDWVVGTAVKEDSRDLSYAVGEAFEKLKESGRFDEIFAAFGVTPNDPMKS